jgi:hypothetical protein
MPPAVAGARAAMGARQWSTPESVLWMIPISAAAVDERRGRCGPLPRKPARRAHRRDPQPRFATPSAPGDLSHSAWPAQAVSATPGESGSWAGQSGSWAGQSGSWAGQSGSWAGQSGSRAGQSGSRAGQSGVGGGWGPPSVSGLMSRAPRRRPAGRDRRRGEKRARRARFFAPPPRSRTLAPDAGPRPARGDSRTGRDPPAPFDGRRLPADPEPTTVLTSCPAVPMPPGSRPGWPPPRREPRSEPLWAPARAARGAPGPRQGRMRVG